MQSDIPTQAISPRVKEEAAAIRAQLRVDLRASELLDTWLVTICTVSPYMARTALQFPDEISRLLSVDYLYPDSVVPNLAQLSDELHDDQAGYSANESAEETSLLDAQLQRVLRRFRHRHLFRILWRDLSGVAELDETLNQLSILAECCITAADQWVYESLCLRYGEPRDEQGKPVRLVVLGMGKLGGYELNVSSDIDLICVYREGGQTTGSSEGKGAIDHSEFFRRSAQGLTKLLNTLTPDGFVYRVDTRLRPFGESGPLVMNFAGLENYYLTQAREWERYAMIKARAITGTTEDIAEVEALITPFVYRRYLDYNAFESLRELKRKIVLSVAQKQLRDNIKLGAGGIREIEFIGQVFQLVRGGQDVRLRVRSIVPVLEMLASLHLLAEEEVEALVAAYRYLRRVENALQMMRDEQLHSLPVDAEDRQRLVMMLDETDWPAFIQHLSAHQFQVSKTFAALFEVESVETGSELGVQAVQSSAAVSDELDSSPVDTQSSSSDQLSTRDVWSLLSDLDATEQQREECLQRAGFEPNDELSNAVESLSRSAFYQRLSADSQERVERIAPMIMQFALYSDNPTETLSRCLALVRAVAGRSGYLQVLSDQPAALSRLVSLFAQSRWLANFVLRQPMVIDEFLAGPGAVIYPDRQQVRSDSLEQLERLRTAELDVQMDSMRHYRQSREMRIACAQLDGSLTLMQVSDQLSWLAESIIEVVLSLVQIPLVAIHGEPACIEQSTELDAGSRRRASVGVVAYGKLGGLELGFGSDLDLVFVHDSVGNAQHTDGEKSIDNSVFYARVAQKFVHFMGTATPAGVLYEIDLRLRPNGSSGVLVTGMDTFANYQFGDAWTWEHQALMRARIVLGNERLRTLFSQTRAGVLAQKRSTQELRETVANMRERMRAAMGNKEAGSMHLKQDDGGVADVEFIVQYLVLAYSAEHPELLIYTDNIRVLDAVEALQLLPATDAEMLRQSYIALRERLHRQALQEAGPVVPEDKALGELRANVMDLKGRTLGAS